MNTIILDPVIPYVAPLSGGSFSPKTLVKLEGEIPPHAYGTTPFTPTINQLDDVQPSNLQPSYDTAMNNSEDVESFGDVSITRISHESISNSISDSTTPLTPTINQLDNVQHSNLPPSYDNGMNSSEDVESQNERIAHTGIFPFRYNRDSPLNATLKNRCNTFFIFLRIIAVTILFGYFIFFIAQYANNEAKNSTYGIPSIDFTAFDQDMKKHFKEIQDEMASREKMDEEIKKSHDILANAKKTEEYNKYFFDLLQTSMLNDEDNTFDYQFVQSPDLKDEVSKEVNDILAKLKQN